MEGSGHPNFMNPFVYGKSLLGKSFPKRIGTLTLPNPKIFRGGHNVPPSRIPDISKLAGPDRVKISFFYAFPKPRESILPKSSKNENIYLCCFVFIHVNMI